MAESVNTTNTSDDMRLTPKGEAYATAHSRAPGSVVGALPTPKRRRIGKRAIASQRAALEAQIEGAIAMLDLLDGDWDAEPSAGFETDGDELDQHECSDLFDEREYDECEKLEGGGEDYGEGGSDEEEGRAWPTHDADRGKATAEAHQLLATIPRRKRRYRGDNIGGNLIPVTFADINPAGGCLVIQGGELYAADRVR